MNKPKAEKAVYVEPSDYFPKEIRKKLKLGEYAEQAKQEVDEKDDSIKNPNWLSYDDMMKQKQECQKEKANNRGKTSKTSMKQ